MTIWSFNQFPLLINMTWLLIVYVALLRGLTCNITSQGGNCFFFLIFFFFKFKIFLMVAFAQTLTPCNFMSKYSLQIFLGYSFFKTTIAPRVTLHTTQQCHIDGQWSHPSCWLTRKTHEILTISTGFVFHYPLKI